MQSSGHLWKKNSSLVLELCITENNKWTRKLNHDSVNCSVLLLIDLTVAFDIVDHSILTHRLSKRVESPGFPHLLYIEQILQWSSPLLH